MLTIVIRVLESMFVLGVLGSAVVVILTSIEDFATLFSKESKPASQPDLGIPVQAPQHSGAGSISHG